MREFNSLFLNGLIEIAFLFPPWREALSFLIHGICKLWEMLPFFLKVVWNSAITHSRIYVSRMLYRMQDTFTFWRLFLTHHFQCVWKLQQRMIESGIIFYEKLPYFIMRLLGISWLILKTNLMLCCFKENTLCLLHSRSIFGYLSPIIFSWTKGE